MYGNDYETSQILKFVDSQKHKNLNIFGKKLH